LYKYHTAVAIPASIVSDIPHLREKTAKLGAIARSCSIFGVDQIIIYADDCLGNQKEDLALCEQILSFLETPQYLRKILFQKSPALQFVGILPPLQIPSHNVPKTIADCKSGDYREGVVLARTQERLRMEVGLESPLECLGNLPKGKRATVKLTSITPHLVGDLVDRSKISIYWGYQVRAQNTSLGTILEKEKYYLKIGTSRYGKQLKDAWSELTDLLNDEVTVMVAFGSPKIGLQEILRRESITLTSVFDMFLNTIPHQETLTVRTEEAIAITLATLNLLRSM
jgi:hypothetical protein